MKFKKIAVVILAVLMIVSTALPIMAADSSDAVCELIAHGQTSGTKYTDFYTALKAINADGYTIKMLVPSYSFAPSQTDVKYNFTWDGEYASGQRCKITLTANAYLMMIHDGATFKNLDVTSYVGLRYSNTVSANPFNLENVNWRIASNIVTNIQGTVGTNAQTMNLTNCRIDTTSTNTGTPVIGIYTGVTGGSPCDVYINLHNSTLTQNGGATNNAGNRAVINANIRHNLVVSALKKRRIYRKIRF